jgi:hypothetical protein
LKPEIYTGLAETGTIPFLPPVPAESQFAWSPWTPNVQNPATRAGSAIFYRGRKEVLLMYLLLLFVFLLVRKRRTKLKVEIDL